MVKKQHPLEDARDVAFNLGGDAGARKLDDEMRRRVEMARRWATYTWCFLPEWFCELTQELGDANGTWFVSPHVMRFVMADPDARLQPVLVLLRSYHQDSSGREGDWEGRGLRLRQSLESLVRGLIALGCTELGGAAGWR